jgi:MSHA pilin protein MshD
MAADFKKNNALPLIEANLSTKEAIAKKYSINDTPTFLDGTLMPNQVFSYKTQQNKNQNGFTLIELILGMVVLAIVMTIITGLLAPQARQSADPVVQIRATELGQAMMNEILAKSFDENSDRSPPWNRCGENAITCTTLITPTPSNQTPNDEGASRANYNDVDDYHGLKLAGTAIENSLGNVVRYYAGFQLDIAVQYDDDFNGAGTSSKKIAKLVTVTVTASNGEVYGFSAYKGNY